MPRPTPNYAAIAERRLKVLELKKLGMSLRQIEQQLNISREQARRDLQQALAQIAKEQSASTEAYRALELERLDMLWQKVLPGVNQNDVGSLNSALRISERRAKLLGLDAPVKQELTGANGGAIAVAREIIIEVPADEPVDTADPNQL